MRCSGYNRKAFQRATFALPAIPQTGQQESCFGVIRDDVLWQLPAVHILDPFVKAADRDDAATAQERAAKRIRSRHFLGTRVEGRVLHVGGLRPVGHEPPPHLRKPGVAILGSDERHRFRGSDIESVSARKGLSHERHEQARERFRSHVESAAHRILQRPAPESASSGSRAQLAWCCANPDGMIPVELMNVH